MRFLTISCLVLLLIVIFVRILVIKVCCPTFTIFVFVGCESYLGATTGMSLLFMI
jgi:hypothetical protein